MATLSDTGAVLVLGATGKTGGRVRFRLAALDRRVRPGSRAATPAFDWADPTGWDAALEGIASVYISYQPDLAVPGALRTVTEFLARARGAGVKRGVLLSGRGEPEAKAAERALMGSGLDWTVLRASWFFQNFSEGFFADDVRRGTMLVPQGLAPEPFIDAEDIADAAVAALTDMRHAGSLYELTGTQALTFRDAMHTIGRELGRPIIIEEVTLADYLAVLEQAGVAADQRWLIEYLFANVLDGRNTATGDGVRQALGRAPATLERFARRSAASGIWSMAA